MPISTQIWEPSDYIDSPTEYLEAAREAAQETGDIRIWHQALQDVKKAKSITGKEAAEVSISV
jgi:hypothetical protein